MPPRRIAGLLCLAALATGCGSDSKDAQFANVEASAASAMDVAKGTGQWREPKIAGCAIGGFAIEDDTAGLKVHAEPSGSSKVIGRLYSLIDVPPSESPQPGDPMVGPNFTIIAVRGDWVQIADIAPVTGGFDKLTRKYREVRNFQGLGWVHQSKVSVATGYWDKAYDRPYHQPGPWTVIDEDAGISLYPWAALEWAQATILDCNKDWVKLRYRRIGTTGAGPENVRYYDKAERLKLAPVEGWLKSEGHSADSALCDPADADCRARRAHDWD